MVQIGNIILKKLMGFILKHDPFELLIETPLDELTELRTHEIELSARVADLVHHHGSK